MHEIKQSPLWLNLLIIGIIIGIYQVVLSYLFIKSKIKNNGTLQKLAQALSYKTYKSVRTKRRHKVIIRIPYTAPLDHQLNKN